ncbi:MAG TPA: hypothetical protein VEB59_07445 [Gemmatimonadales bacterium]|nr:hypothetical protein [Gemmatimonadales bacterium]
MRVGRRAPAALPAPLRLFRGALAGVALMLPSAAAAQNSRCTFQIDNVDRQGSVVETGSGTNYFAGGNVRLSCRGTRISMQSDSVAAYGGNVVQFIGRVKYRDSTITMDADRGTYYKVGERWEARGNVTTENLTNGSTLTGPSLDYFRVVKGVRDTLEMFATGRPKIRYATMDSAGRSAEPYQIVADRVRFKGNDRIFAGGKVTIDRTDFAARGDSLRLDTGPAGEGSLTGGTPTLRGLGPDSFMISGTRIDMKLDRRELTYLLARGSGHAVNREWDLVADTIALDINAKKLEQTLAWGDKTRPNAKSPSYQMTADSLALDTPAQQLREVRGFGKAWLGGTIHAASNERDWMRGDTVVARFTTGDSAGHKRALLSRIEARQAAQSYHLDTNARVPTRPSINYARGEAIVVTMKEGLARGVDRVDIRGKVDGIQLEASSDTNAVPADSAGRAGPPAPDGGESDLPPAEESTE